MAQLAGVHATIKPSNLTLLEAKLLNDTGHHFHHPEQLNVPKYLDTAYLSQQLGIDVGATLFYAALGLIVHIILMNAVAVTTLIYGILTPPAVLSVHVVFSHRQHTKLLAWSARPSPVGSVNGNSNTERGIRRQAISASSPSIDLGNLPSNRRHKIDCTTYPYLLSLAISDLLIGVLIAPLQLQLQMNSGSWYLGTYLCDLWRALDIFFCTSSALHTSVLAVDRWWTITKADSSSTCFCIVYILSTFAFWLTASVPTEGAQLQKTMLAFLWILSAMISFPVMYLWQIETPDQGDSRASSTSCSPVTDPHFIILSTLVSFFMPLVLTIAFYIQIALMIRQRWAQLKLRTFAQFGALLGSMLIMGGRPGQRGYRHNPRRQCSAGDPKLCNTNGCKHLTPIDTQKGGNYDYDDDDEGKVYNNNSRRKKPRGVKAFSVNNLSNMEVSLIALKRHSRLIRAMAVVVTMYCICWMPLYTTLFVKAVCVVCPDNALWERLLSAFTWLGYANSGINPIIYFATLEEFRILAKGMVRALVERIIYWPRAMVGGWRKLVLWVRLRNGTQADVAGDNERFHKELLSALKKGDGNSQSVGGISRLAVGSPVRVASPPLFDSDYYAVENGRPCASTTAGVDNKCTMTPATTTTSMNTNEAPQSLCPYYDSWGRPINALSLEATI